MLIVGLFWLDILEWIIFSFILKYRCMLYVESQIYVFKFMVNFVKFEIGNLAVYVDHHFTTIVVVQKLTLGVI